MTDDSSENIRTERALAEALAKTGFPFEYHVFSQFAAAGWSTKSNRLYVDVEEEKTREMDLLCYKASWGVLHTTFTVVLISCKSRLNKPWVLLAREWPILPPGAYPYPPVPVWTNHPVLAYEVGRSSWGKDYFDLAEASGLTRWSADSPREVFALQEFVPTRTDSSGKTSSPLKFNPKGDSSLYEGTMSLVKALVYETSAVKARRAGSGERFVYQFNLVQLLDGELYEASFGREAAPAVRKVDRYRYFARTMLDGQDFSARIDFCTKAGLGQLLQDLARVHDFNALHFKGRIENHYEYAIQSQERLDAMIPEMQRRLATYVQLLEGVAEDPPSEWIAVTYNAHEEGMKVLVALQTQTVQRLKRSPFFMRRLKMAVQDLYGYQGDVQLEKMSDDPPFRDHAA